MTVHEKTGTVAAGTSVSGTKQVERGLEGIRLAVFGILVSVALGAASLTTGWWRPVAAIGSAAALAFSIWWPVSRRVLMALMHRITRV